MEREALVRSLSRLLGGVIDNMAAAEPADRQKHSADRDRETVPRDCLGGAMEARLEGCRAGRAAGNSSMRVSLFRPANNVFGAIQLLGPSD